MNEMCEKTSGCTNMDMLSRAEECAISVTKLDILTKALFNAASLGYNGKSLSFDSLMLDAVVHAVYPISYLETLKTLREKAMREHENTKPEDDEF